MTREFILATELAARTGTDATTWRKRVRFEKSKQPPHVLSGRNILFPWPEVSEWLRKSSFRSWTLEDRFSKYVTIDEKTGCHDWTGTCSGNGYGKVSVGGQRHKLAHRIAYELKFGAVPDGLELDHLCRNRRCVNTDHLEPVTRRENCLRGISIAAENARKTHCLRGHEFTPENTATSKKGGRYCLSCRRLKNSKRRNGNG